MENNKKKRSTLEIRKKHNNDLIKRLRKGDNLCAYESSASWFPPRPIIKKDKEGMKRLYDDSGSDKGEKN